MAYKCHNCGAPILVLRLGYCSDCRSPIPSEILPESKRQELLQAEREYEQSRQQTLENRKRAKKKAKDRPDLHSANLDLEDSN